MAFEWYPRREYKIKTLEIIKKVKPNYYIDIGCGIGEILNKAIKRK